MDGPSNFNSVMDHYITNKFDANFEICLHWRFGLPTYYSDKPYLIKERWPEDMVVLRRWYCRDDDPGFRVIFWQSIRVAGLEPSLNLLSLLLYCVISSEEITWYITPRSKMFIKNVFLMWLPHTCSYPRIPNNEMLRDASAEYIRQICFGSYP